MATTATVTPIRPTRVVVDDETQDRMRSLLEQIRGFAMRPVRKVGGWLRRAFNWVKASAPVQWGRSIARRGWAIARSVADRLGRAGVIAAAVGTATSRRGQVAIAATGRFVVNTSARVIDLVLGGTAQVLKAVPGPTRWAGHQLNRLQAWLGGLAAAGMNWGGWTRLRNWLSPDKSWVRRLNAAAQGFAFGRLVRAFIQRTWLRIVVIVVASIATAPAEERATLRRIWNEQVTMRGERNRIAAMWQSKTPPTMNGVPAEHGKAAQEAVVDLERAAELAEVTYGKISEKTLEFFAKDSKFSTQGACAKALYTLVHPQFKELLRSQQAAKAAKEYAGLMVHSFQTGEVPFDNLGEKGDWNPVLVEELRDQAKAVVTTHNVPAPVR